jgi:hypothetical protein
LDVLIIGVDILFSKSKLCWFLAEIGGLIGYAGVDDTREIVPSDAWVSGPVGGL